MIDPQVHKKMLLVLWASASAASASAAAAATAAASDAAAASPFGAVAAGADLCANPGCTCGRDSKCGSCYCDTPAACAQYGNCCADHLQICPAPPPTPPPTPPAPGQPGYKRWSFPEGPGTSGGEIDNAAAATGGGRVFFTSAKGGGTLYAVHAASGKEAWHWAPGNGTGSTGDFSAPATTADGAAVFYAASRGGVATLHALEGASGKALWSTPLPGPGSIEGPPALGSSAAAAADDSGSGSGTALVFLALSGSTHAVDAASGAVRWSNATLGCSATGAAAGDGAVFVASSRGEGALVALEAGTGAHRWTARSSASEWARPVVAALDGGETLVCVRRSLATY